jgi:hypothetical protein
LGDYGKHKQSEQGERPNPHRRNKETPGERKKRFYLAPRGSNRGSRRAGEKYTNIELVLRGDEEASRVAAIISKKTKENKHVDH